MENNRAENSHQPTRRRERKMQRSGRHARLLLMLFWSGLRPVPYSKEGQKREFDQQVTRNSRLSL